MTALVTAFVSATFPMRGFVSVRTFASKRTFVSSFVAVMVAFSEETFLAVTAVRLVTLDGKKKMLYIFSCMKRDLKTIQLHDSVFIICDLDNL